MRMHIRPLWDASQVFEALRDDGWVLAPQPDGSAFANHPAVADEAAARQRLDDLGLRTSGAVHIEFQPIST